MTSIPERSISTGGTQKMQERRKLPKFDYYLDESDPDIAVLRRQDGTFVAAFSAQGATRESILEAAEEDYLRITQKTTQALVEVYHRR